MCKRIFASQTNSDGEVPFFKIGTIGGVPDSYISSSLFEDYKRRFNFPEVGEVLITCSGTVGRCLQYDGRPAYYQDSNIVWLHGDKSPIECGFLYWLLKRHDWKTLNTTTISRIYSSDLLNLKLSFPTAEEQEKITHFLILVDRRIAVQNKIIEALGGLKKAIYERIFGSDFLGATLQPLGDFMEIPKLEKEIRPDRNRLITVKLNEAGVVRNTNVESLKMSGTIYYKRSAGQFIYGKQNLFHGAFGIVPKELNGYCSSADVPSLSFNGSIEPSLLIRAISYCAYNWEKYSSGTGSKRIHETTLLGLTVPIPAKEHIGRCKKLLDLIDHKIECERKLLRLMEMQKRYLLAEMFI